MIKLKPLILSLALTTGILLDSAGGTTPANDTQPSTPPDTSITCREAIGEDLRERGNTAYFWPSVLQLAESTIDLDQADREASLDAELNLIIAENLQPQLIRDIDAAIAIATEKRHCPIQLQNLLNNSG
ncbi:MAG: hypothetical protein U5M23_00330 [Marinagarivorans sp.]|nr:hypothetical protein [Marinagarivorans sp.]